MASIIDRLRVKIAGDKAGIGKTETVVQMRQAYSEHKINAESNGDEALSFEDFKKKRRQGLDQRDIEDTTGDNMVHTPGNSRTKYE